MKVLLWMGVLTMSLCSAAAAQDGHDLVALPQGRLVYLDDEAVTLIFGLVGFDPDYGWKGVQKGTFEAGPNRFSDSFGYKFDPGTVSGLRELVGVKDGALSVKYTLKTEQPIPVKYVAATIEFPGSSGVATIVATGRDGETRLGRPIPIGTIAEATSLRMLSEDGTELMRVGISPARSVIHDGNLRIDLSGPVVAAGETSTVLTVAPAAGTTLRCGAEEVPDVPDIDRWFAFEPENDTADGAAGLAGWLHKPAGVHGGVRLDGDDLRFEDGTPVRLWGTNVEYADTAPPKPEAEQTARWFAKYGINAVRQHKLTNPGWEGLGTTNSAAEYDPEKLDRFDYFNNELRKNGVYYGFSPIWNLKVFDGDREALKHYDELKRVFNGDLRGFVWFFEDVQDLYIRTMVNLIGHENPYTGLRYADDPALAYIEIQNEDNVFFYTTMGIVWRSPSYKRDLGVMFCDWLRARYGDGDAKLREAWGDGAFGFARECMPDESLDANTILPVCNPWMLDNMIDHPARKRLLDTARFLFECQQRYYARMTKAIRDLGYEGPLVGSPWQAGSRNGHLLNLYSDASVGIVDRHNYTGGGTHNVYLVTPSTYNDTCLLDSPGSSLLSTGLQQVAGHPFALSEWVTVVPAQYGAADTSVIAAYGMGLQGWDMSYFFSSLSAGFTPHLCAGRSKAFNNQVPHLIGIFPALSRMVLRGDVTESEIVSERPVHLESLFNDEVGFEERTIQQHDIKAFTGSVPYQMMAVGRSVYRFVDEPTPFVPVDPDDYRRGDELVSVTRQLKWHDVAERRRNWVTIDTAGTQALLGFLHGASAELKDVDIRSDDDYACVFVSAASPEGRIADDGRLLITAIARVRNTGMKYMGNYIFTSGEAPMVVEPVVATIRLKRGGSPTVYVCDHDGRRTDRTVPVAADGTVRIDTGRDRAIYYEVVY